MRSSSSVSRLCLAIALACLPPRDVAAQPSSARSAVDTAAAVRVARATFQEAERAIAARTWTRRDTTVVCEEKLELEVTTHRDATGRVRQLTWSGGSDDHAETHRYYYDASGRLRFAFFTLGAVNGTHHEERVYFDDRGAVVRRLERLVKGPGYATRPEEGIMDPESWLRDPCR